MKFEFRNISKKKNAILVVAFLSLAAGVLVSFFGELFIAPAAAFLAALFLFEAGDKRIFSFAVPIATVLLNIFIGGFYSVRGIEPLVIALIICLMYTKGRAKTECVVAVCVTVAVFILASLYFDVVNITGSFDIGTVKGFYVGIYEELKAGFVEQITAISVTVDGSVNSVFTEEDATVLFDSVAKQLISMLIIISFIITGLTMKIFTAAIYRAEKEPHVVVGWRFSVTNIFAYFYGALFFLNMFFGVGVGTFEVIIANLYSVFMIVFAYFGFCVARDFISRGRSRGFATAVLIVGIVLLSSLALQILSVVGLFSTINQNKLNSINGDK